MSRLFYLIALFLFGSTSVFAQYEDIQIKVYDFDEGLSHRNVFKIDQDTCGYIWLATINGLNRFDGMQFVQYNSRSTSNTIPFDAISDLHIDDQNKIWLANPDFLTALNPATNRVDTNRIKQGELKRRESLVPYNLTRDAQGRLWMASYNEKSARTFIQLLDRDLSIQTVIKVKGNYSKRPIAHFAKATYVGAFENELWQINEAGERQNTFRFPLSSYDRTQSRVVQLQVENNRLWVLLADGRIFVLKPGATDFELHPISTALRKQSIFSSFLVEPNGDIWVGGQSKLWYFHASANKIINYSNRIRQSIKNIASFRQIFRDRSDVLWIASDFGAIKIVQSDDLFSQYLSGGNENCSNVLCSTRGITEDEEGRIYISYYSSIHLFDPRRNAVRPLFPLADYFNYPFGLLYHDKALYTGNGKRIDLNTLQVDTIFDRGNSDLGAIVKDQEGLIWFGYKDELFSYNPATNTKTPFEDQYGNWKAKGGSISYLYQGRNPQQLWVATLDNGLFLVDKTEGRIKHYSDRPESPALLANNQVNAIYEDAFGYLWLGTGIGLHRLELATDSLNVYSTDQGLPNNFINGLLSEGDSCLWISTDDGLCRFSIDRTNCLNFFQRDGLSSNEFNRMSFFKASDGRMYFGGLNGINAFYPSKRFLARKNYHQDAPMMFTSFSRYSNEEDQLHQRSYGLAAQERIELDHTDRFFSFSYALADYRNPLLNQYSYKLEPYEKDWSPPSAATTVRYNNIPAGNYTFKVRARVGKEDWHKNELAIQVIIEEAYYKTWWFISLAVLLFLGAVYGFLRYRIYVARLREKALEKQVRQRTTELQEEKRKSEELLLNILPAETADELKKFGVAKAKRHEFVTVMFSDFKGFSKIAEAMEPEALVAEIDLCFRNFDKIIERHGLEKIKTVGDAYLCVGGISNNDTQEALRVVQAALEIQRFLKNLSIEKQAKGEHFFEARIGLHTGPVVAGIVGIKKFAYDIWGDTVNIAARMESHSQAGRVNLSESTYQLVKEDVLCSCHGQYTENNGENINMYFVEEVGVVV
ncbi:MAG: adenylate/guanylate cyclase domain-containing protein [Bacteroidota bacterium]